MASPTRFPQGVTNAAPWQFFSGLGLPNPFFYHQFADDFDVVPTTALPNGWTITAATGTVTQPLISDGGDALLSTTGVLNDFVSIQRTAATFMPAAGKKTYFIANLTLSDVVASAFVAGMMPSTVTPFVNPANGIWISKASGTSVINLNVANNSVVTTTPFPASAFTLTNNVSFDVGFLYTPGSQRNAGVPRIVGSIGPNLVGYIPQSGTGAANSTNRTPNVASPVTVLATLTSTVLAPVVAVQAGAAAIKTMTVDYVGAFRER
jgi:hypothetical protein